MPSVDRRHQRMQAIQKFQSKGYVDTPPSGGDHGDLRQSRIGSEPEQTEPVSVSLDSGHYEFNIF